MPTLRTEVDIDVYEFLDDCYDSEFDEIIEYIKDNHPEKLHEFRNVLHAEPGLIHDTQKKLLELGEHAYKFTPDEEDFLDKMYKKYL